MACGALQTRSGSGVLPGLIDAPFRDADRSSSPHPMPIIQTVKTNVAGVADERAMERSRSGC
jgi:hypothetical protein